MRKYMKEILPAFIDGKKMKTKTAETEFFGLWSYNTAIAVFDVNGAIYLRSRTFSKTTSSQQNAIREFARERGIPLVECDDETFYSHFNGMK